MKIVKTKTERLAESIGIIPPGAGGGYREPDADLAPVRCRSRREALLEYTLRLIAQEIQPLTGIAELVVAGKFARKALRFRVHSRSGRRPS